MIINPTTAALAKLTTELEWGSEHQIVSQNLLCDWLAENISSDEFHDFEDYCLKATTEEMAARAIQLLEFRTEVYLMDTVIPKCQVLSDGWNGFCVVRVQPAQYELLKARLAEENDPEGYSDWMNLTPDSDGAVSIPSGLTLEPVT